MQQTGVFCRELTPTKTEHLMNRARKELNKLEKVIKSKKLRAERSSSLEQEQSNSKAKVNVSSLVKAKKNEMCVPDEHGLEIDKVKEKKKKHKSKSKDYSCEKNELNNTLSLGLRVNIELANEHNDIALNPKHLKNILVKHGSQDSPRRLKEKTEKVKSDENKKQKGVRQANTKSVSKTCQKLVDKESPEEIAENQENLEKNKIDLTLSATVIKTDKRKKLKATNEPEETICATKHKKKKSKRESSPLEKTVCYEETVSSQNKRHKNDRNYDSSTFQIEERKKKTRKKEHTESSLEIETEHKSKKKKKKHKDIHSEDLDKQSEERKHKGCKKDEGESYVDSSNMIKKTKKKKTIENIENLENSYNVYYNESAATRKEKHQQSRDIENVNESLILDSSCMHKKKKKKHKDAKESDTSFMEASYGESKNNTEETNFTETESYYTSESPNKRKRTKHKTSAFELEVEDVEVCSKKRKKEKVVEISNECTIDIQKKKKHREDSEELTELTELQKKSKKRKSTEKEVMHSVLEFTKSKREKESKHIKEDELGSKSTKHKKKRGKKYKDIENTDYSSENIQESNSNESASLLGQDKKVKKKRRRLVESDTVQNVLSEGEHQIENMPDVDSVVKNSEESFVTASDHENGQMKKKKKKKRSKSKERDRAEIYSEVTSEIDSENASQNVSPLMTPVPSKANTFGPSVMERLLYGFPDPVAVATETCAHCTQCSHDATAKHSSVPPVVNTMNAKQEMLSTPKLQDDVEKPPVVENIVDTIVIKKEPGLETENSNPEVIEPVIFIDVNNLNIKQEPGLETETPPDQANDSMQLKLHKDDEQRIEIKKEPGTETQNNLSAAVPSMDTLAPEAEQQLPNIKKEHVMEQPNLSAEGACAVSNIPPEDTYLNSVISAEGGAPGFFRHTSTSNNNIAASEYQGVSVEKTQYQVESSSTAAEVPKAESSSTAAEVPKAESSSTAAEVPEAESANNVPDNAGYVAIPQQQDSPEHQLTSKEASSNSERSSVQRRQPPLREEWVYEYHLVDVPCAVPLREIAYYFRVPTTKVREYPGYGKKRLKHVVVLLSHYNTCLRVSKKQRLFGSRHTFLWSFKKYVRRDS